MKISNIKNETKKKKSIVFIVFKIIII